MLNKAKTKGKVMREMTSMRFERVGNLESQVRHQLGLAGCMWISHCRAFSMVIGSPGWRTSGFCNYAYALTWQQLPTYNDCVGSMHVCTYVHVSE